MSSNGGVPERPNGTVSKTVVGETPPRVRIPAPPPVVMTGIAGYLKLHCQPSSFKGSRVSFAVSTSATSSQPPPMDR